MLQTNKPHAGGQDGSAYFGSQGDQEELVIDIERLWGAFKRQYKLIVFCCVVGIVLGLVYILTAQPLYTASTQILIDDQNSKTTDLETSLNVGFDTAKIDSQVELLRSERIALSVIEKLALTNDVAFLNARGSVISKGISGLRSLLSIDYWLPVDGELSAEERDRKTRAALAILGDNLDVRRVGITYVLSINYTSPSPAEAARLANAFGEAYLLDQLEAKYDATRRASDWLQRRIEGLKESSLATDLAVQRFRAENNLVSADGLLLGEQQLADMNSQLILSRAATAQAEARYRRIQDIIDTGQMDAAVTEALNNSVIADLRSKFLEASKRYAEISQKLGANHVQALKFKSDMIEYQKVIFDELGRIAQSYRSDFEIAKSRELSLEGSLSSLIGESATTNETLVALRELERESETYRNLYQTFLQRYQETVQQQSFPITEARVISSARPPSGPSAPKKALVLVFSLVLGGMAGTGFGALREFRDRGVRTGEQVRERLGLEFLGILPILPHKPVKASKNLDGDKDKSRRFVQPSDTVMRQSLDAPLSGFAETLRSAKIAADLMLGDKQSKILGTVSIFPGEGKSTVSKNFASLLANLGAKTLLIDCDLRNPGLTRGIANQAESGLLEVLLEEQDLKSSLLVEPDSKLFVLPAVVRQRVSHTSELLASPAMKRLLREASEAFDYIIVDLPPLAPVVDVRAIADQIDAFLFVVEWGKTPRQTIRSTLSHDRRFSEKCLGVVLNKVDTQAQKLYEKYNSEGYQHSSYSRYYSE
ncbi:polysaccharide biosynthesis tyrosine autokinase [uncultured Roseibium sp.]|uniref:polysaccharide biosynthesis tyrosine autokinase n=1 Tax=uncultured Roseibium sp. TaxID=1936171 RepID=UPI00259133A8|nr:polysaccharide biosynthesis tyrosine autokinase [uncultured Roseibium sp.]